MARKTSGRIKRGDVVCLKSDATVKMIVEGYDCDEEDGVLQVCWLDSNKTMQEANLHEDLLQTIVTEE